jgi:hypothetical protein
VWDKLAEISKWRNQTEHRMNQRQGYGSMFESYTITIASQLRSYSNIERSAAPEDSNRLFG